MKSQTTLTLNHFSPGQIFRLTFFAFQLLFLSGAFLPVLAAPESMTLWAESEIGGSRKDTIPTITGNIPLAKNPDGLSRQKFNTVHVMVGVGGTTSNYSELNPLGIKRSPISIPLSVYVHIPFGHNYPGLFLLSGLDIDLVESNRSAFRALLIYQSRSGIMLGAGAGRTSFGYYDEIHVETSQTQGLLAFGVNLSPRRADLLLTVPLAPRLSTRFDGIEYSVRPAGIQLSLLLSIR